MTNPVINNYRRRCLDPRESLRDVVARAPFLPRYLEYFGVCRLPKPFFVSENEIGGAADDPTLLFDILRDLPRRMFNGDLAWYRQTAGFDERQGELNAPDRWAATRAVQALRPLPRRHRVQAAVADEAGDDK